MTKAKVSVLTNAQIYTLRRLASGTAYRVQGNGKRAFERRPCVDISGGQWKNSFNDVNAPSIPPLIRKGLVMINPIYNAKPDSYYPVVLTAEGCAMAKTAVIHE